MRTGIGAADVRRFVGQLSDDDALACTVLLLDESDGAPLELALLDELLPLVLPLMGFEALARPHALPTALRARLFAHLVELEATVGENDAAEALSEEPAAVVEAATALLEARFAASVAESR